MAIACVQVLTLFLVLYVNHMEALPVTTEATVSPCLYHLIPGQALQDCISVLGFLNATVNTQDEMCFMYTEALFCIKRAVDKASVHCSIQDIQRITQPYFHIVPGLRFDQCNVTRPPTGAMELCSTDKLSTVSLLTCRPYLEQMLSYPGINCIFSKYLVSCINKHLSYLGATCSEADTQTAVDSPMATSWLHEHYPSISLANCFDTEGVKPDEGCVDTLTMFNYPEISHCPTILGKINFTEPGATPHKDGCSLVQEVFVCMQNALKMHGSQCSLAQMKSALKGFLSLSGGIFGDESILEQCPVDEEYGKTSLCKDEYRLTTYITHLGHDIFDLVDGYPDDANKCSYVVSYSQTVLSSVGATDCSSHDIFSALSSSYGKSVMMLLYPNIDVSYCLNHVTVTSQVATVTPDPNTRQA